MVRVNYAVAAKKRCLPAFVFLTGDPMKDASTRYFIHDMDNFQSLLMTFGTNYDNAHKISHEIYDMYQAPGRYYHNMDHISQCLSLVHKAYSTHLTSNNMRTIELALWFHDTVQDKDRHDNEELSAALLTRYADDYGINPLVVEVARAAIIATNHRNIPENFIDKWVTDIDLSILSATKNTFDDYEKNGRKEYSHIDDLNWITGRTKFFHCLLEREWIYSTSDFRKLYEGAARSNVKRSLERLDNGEILV